MTPVTATRLQTNSQMAGLVLCGGKSQRMGQPKERLPHASGDFLHFAISELHEAGLPVFVARNSNQTLSLQSLPANIHVTEFEDRWPGCGPMGAIATAWHLLPEVYQSMLVIPCDMPNLTRTILTSISRAYDSQSVFACFESGRWQPLCAIYARHTCTVFEEALNAGNFSMQHLLNEKLSPTPFPELLFSTNEIRKIFSNINTPDDYRRWQGELPHP